MHIIFALLAVLCGAFGLQHYGTLGQRQGRIMAHKAECAALVSFLARVQSRALQDQCHWSASLRKTASGYELIAMQAPIGPGPAPSEDHFILGFKFSGTQKVASNFRGNCVQFYGLLGMASGGKFSISDTVSGHTTHCIISSRGHIHVER